MQEVECANLIKGELYYIQSISNEKSRQIAKFKELHNKNFAKFENIGEIIKQDGTMGHSRLCFGNGSRHSYWFRFYRNYKVEYDRKLENLYKRAINQHLQQIIGDDNFCYIT